MADINFLEKGLVNWSTLFEAPIIFLAASYSVGRVRVGEVVSDIWASKVDDYRRLVNEVPESSPPEGERYSWTMKATNWIFH